MQPGDESVRVLHTIDSLRLGGAEALLAALIRELSRNGISSFVVAASNRGAAAELVEAIDAGAEALHLLDGRSLYDPRIAAGMARAIRRHRVDVVHSHLSHANFNSRLVALGLRVPHMTTIHTLPGRTAEDSRASILADGATARLSRLIVAPSEELASAYASTFRIAASKFRVIPNAPAAAPPASGFDRERLRAELLDGDSGRIVVCVARLQPEKGIDELIEVATLLRERVPDARILVAGEGPEQARLRARIAAEHREHEITLLGRRGDIGELLAAADAFCLPSRHEGVPLSLLEAMAAGLPCVVTSVGGIPSLVSDQINGLLVSARDVAGLTAALERVLTDNQLARALGDGAREVVSSRFSPTAVAARYAELYRELAGSHVRWAGRSPDGRR